MPIDWNSVVQNPDFILFPMFLSGGLVALGIVIAFQWRRAQQAKYNFYLKERLIERGFSADEIIRVVSAGVQPERAARAERHHGFWKHTPC